MLLHECDYASLNYDITARYITLNTNGVRLFCLFRT